MRLVGKMQKQENGKKVFSILIVLILLLLTACGGNSKSNSEQNRKETIKIGALMSFSGNFAALGEGMKRGLELYFEENNYMIGDRKVEIIYEDDENNPQIALRKYRKLIQNDKVDMVVGIASSTVLYGLRDQVDKDKVPLLVANAGANGISWDQKSDYIYRSSYSNWQIGSGAAEYFAKNIGDKIFILASEYPAGVEQVEGFIDKFEEAGGEVLDVIYTKVGTTNFASYMPEIAKANPNVVASFHTGSDGIRFIMQYQEFGFKSKIPLITQATSDLATTPEIIKAMEGSYNSMMYTLSLDNPANKKFIEAYNKKYNENPMGGYEVQGYDAGQVLGTVFEKTKSLESTDVIDVFKNTVSIESPRGPLTIDPGTHNPISNVYVQKFVIKEGKLDFEIIEEIPGIAMPENPPK